MLEIPPRRKIWLRSDDRSHPEEKSGQGVTDPTPKRNLVKERQIVINLDGSHPEENFGWGMKRILDIQKVDLDLWSTSEVMTSK